jgi:hypothetical protein
MQFRIWLAPTITKYPSLKPARASTKQSTRVALTKTKYSSFKPASCSKITCSLKLKHSKFPDYLMISHGGLKLREPLVMKLIKRIRKQIKMFPPATQQYCC